MTNNEKINQKVCLVVIDGWGLADGEHGNAIAKAKTPVMDKLCSGNWQKLEAHGLHVGLPEGLMGNSEVGHLNIGAGRIIYQVNFCYFLFSIVINLRILFVLILR